MGSSALAKLSRYAPAGASPGVPQTQQTDRPRICASARSINIPVRSFRGAQFLICFLGPRSSSFHAQTFCFSFPFGRIVSVVAAFMLLICPSKPFNLPLLFNRWLFSTEVWYNAQPLPSAGPVSCRRILCQSLHLRSTGRFLFICTSWCSVSRCSSRRRYAIGLLVHVVTSSCLATASSLRQWLTRATCDAP